MTTKVGDEMLEGGGNLPTEEKGDLVVHDGITNQRLPVGADGQVLTADSSQSLGVKWADAGGGSGGGGRFVGELAIAAIETPPSGWLLCDGSEVSRDTYSDLFNAIGTAYGEGDGSTTFNLPDFRGRVPLGAGQGSHALQVSSISVTTDILTVPSNDTLHNGQAVVYTSSGDEAEPLVSGHTYYVIRVSDTQVKLALTRADAIAGNAINIGSSGSGVQKLTYNMTDRARGAKGGIEAEGLVIDEMPAHSHTYDNHLETGTGWPYSTAGGKLSQDTGETGGSELHYNLPPYTTVNVFIYAGV